MPSRELLELQVPGERRRRRSRQRVAVLALGAGARGGLGATLLCACVLRSGHPGSRRPDRSTAAGSAAGRLCRDGLDERAHHSRALPLAAPSRTAACLLPGPVPRSGGSGSLRRMAVVLDRQRAEPLRRGRSRHPKDFRWRVLGKPRPAEPRKPATRSRTLRRELSPRGR
jgi:hypothetical protein